MASREGVRLGCTDGGLTWATPYPPSNGPPARPISFIAPAWNDPLTIYIGFNDPTGGMYRSTDGGAHWENASGSTPALAFPALPVNALAVDQYDPEVVYAATTIGVFRTIEAGDTWELFDDTLPDVIVTGIELQRGSNRLFLSTMGRGVYWRQL